MWPLALIVAVVIAGQTTSGTVTATHVVNADAIAGRQYYVLDGAVCRANAPGRPLIRTWKDHIEFERHEIVLWGTLCNDVATRRPLNLDALVFARDLSTVMFQSQLYQYHATPPRLCEEGTWCSATSSNNP